MARNNSRTTNTIYNFASSIGGQFITILMQFIVRTVFIYTLGKSYLGISGLFSNILSMLSLAEFGVGNAILFKLYEPIAKEDHHRIALLMKFYKKIYTMIGIAVFTVGLILIPFLPKFISDYDKLSELHINAALIFVLYLSNSVSSYLFFAYKSSIIRANQKEYLINLIGYIFTIAVGLLQIVLLIVFHNFELYVAVQVLSIIVQNIICAKLAARMYPYINEKTNEKIDKTEITEVIKDCSALFLYRLNGVVLQATDNIIISMFLGIEMVGMYSNYYIFYTTIDGLFGKVFNSVAHSLGNSHTSHDVKHEYQVFESVCLITAILGGTAGIGIAIVSNDFVTAWVGNEWLIAQPFSILMGIEVFTLSFRQSLSKYRTSMGLFQQAKYRPLAGMIINLVVSIVLVRVWGICGVLVGTIIADWSTTMWFDPLITHKYGLKNAYPVSRYYLKTLKYLLTVSVVGILDWLICTHIMTGLNWISVCVHAVICIVTVPCALMAVSVRKPEGQYVCNLAKGYAKKIMKKIKK